MKSRAVLVRTSMIRVLCTIACGNKITLINEHNLQTSFFLFSILNAILLRNIWKTVWAFTSLYDKRLQGITQNYLEKSITYASAPGRLDVNVEMFMSNICPHIRETSYGKQKSSSRRILKYGRSRINFHFLLIMSYEIDTFCLYCRKRLGYFLCIG